MEEQQPLRNFETRIKAYAKEHEHADWNTVLKDYALSYILAGLAEINELQDNLIFKGGTALRKCYFDDYRFSEDLDFTSNKKWSNEDLDKLVTEALKITSKKVEEYGKFSFTLDERKHKGEHPFGQRDYRVVVIFPTGAVVPIKLEITQEEKVMMTPQDRPISLALPGEKPITATVKTYALEEIVAEKLRAFLQTKQKLDEGRKWANRERDLYDLWALEKRGVDLDWSAVTKILKEKAQQKGVSFTGPEDFKDQRIMDIYESRWTNVAKVTTGAPTFEEAKVGFDKVLDKVFKDASSKSKAPVNGLEL